MLRDQVGMAPVVLEEPLVLGEACIGGLCALELCNPEFRREGSRPITAADRRRRSKPTAV